MNSFLLRSFNTARTRYLFLLLAGGFLFWVLAMPAFAATNAESGDVDWFKLGMGLLGGLAMFLFGMEQMSEGLKAAAGDKDNPVDPEAYNEQLKALQQKINAYDTRRQAFQEKAAAFDAELKKSQQ